MLHPDAITTELIGRMVDPILAGDADLCLAHACPAGMALANGSSGNYLVNRGLTSVENRIMGTISPRAIPATAPIRCSCS